MPRARPGISISGWEIGHAIPLPVGQPLACSRSILRIRRSLRQLIEAVHHARTQLVTTEGVRITINVIPNGYHMRIGDMNHVTELFLGTACIWRVCQRLLRRSLILLCQSNRIERMHI